MQRGFDRGLAYGDQGIFIRRSAFFTVGPFCEEPILEDLILMRAVRRVGWPVLLPVSFMSIHAGGCVAVCCGRQVRNWLLVAAYHLGVPPARLARHYRQHAEGVREWRE